MKQKFTKKPECSTAKTINVLRRWYDLRGNKGERKERIYTTKLRFFKEAGWAIKITNDNICVSVPTTYYGKKGFHNYYGKKVVMKKDNSVLCGVIELFNNKPSKDVILSREGSSKRIKNPLILKEISTWGGASEVVGVRE